MILQVNPELSKPPFFSNSQKGLGRLVTLVPQVLWGERIQNGWGQLGCRVHKGLARSGSMRLRAEGLEEITVLYGIGIEFTV